MGHEIPETLPDNLIKFLVDYETQSVTGPSVPVKQPVRQVQDFMETSMVIDS